MALNIDYTDKIVVVIGGTSGINRGIAELFAKHGANVAVASRNPNKVDDTVSSLKKFGDRAMGFCADVRDFDAIVAGVNDVKKTWVDLMLLYQVLLVTSQQWLTIFLPTDSKQLWTSICGGHSMSCGRFFPI